MNDVLTRQEKIQQIRDFFNKTKIDKSVTQHTLNKEYSNVNPELLTTTSGKLLRIHKNEVDPDDRDNLLFSKFHGLEDHLVQHVQKDAGKLNAKARMKMEQKKNLSWLDAGFWSPQLRSVLVSNSLTQPIDGINPIEFLSLSHKVTKMGEGGIFSSESVPQESHQISDSSFGWIDPMQVPESLDIGVTSYFTQGTRKGFDNKLYKLVKDKNGNKVWKDHETLLNSVVDIPEY